MEYLNTRKQKFNRFMLYVGYFSVSIAILFGAVMLVYQAYGVGLKNGQVVQSGLILFSSRPTGADIYINNVKYQSGTNTSAVLQAGIYKVRITKPGYTDWRRTIELDGNTVLHFDYPLLFPTTLKSNPLQSFTSPPAVASQSPDQRWVVVSQPGTFANFSIYDLKNVNKAPVQISLPADTLTAGSNEHLDVISWADDNNHVLLKHSYDAKSEYVLLNRANPDQSINLNKVLNLDPGLLTLRNQKYDKYFAFDVTTGSLQSLSLTAITPVKLVDNVLAFAGYGDDTVLYVTPTGMAAGKVELKLSRGGKTYNLHAFNSGTSYVLNVNSYKGTLYVSAGAASENKVYIYADPVGQIGSDTTKTPSPVQVLHVTQPNSIQFSSTAQFIVVENGQQFGVYDIKNTQGYNYSLARSLDQPQTHAHWIDKFHLAYVSENKLIVFDYDGSNSRSLVAASPAYMPFFESDYTGFLNMSPSGPSGQTSLMLTPLIVK